MILTCEECKTRYLVPSSAIGEGGRVVKCTKCGHEWFQDYEPIDADFIDMIDDEPETEAEEETGDEEDQGGEDIPAAEEFEVFDPIPEGVKPLPDDAVPALPGEKKEKKKAGALAGYLAAAVVILAVTAALVVFRAPVVKAWPPASGLYELAGIAPDVPGEGLILDRIKAVARVDESGRPVLDVEGVVVNITSQNRPIPAMQSILKTVDGEIYDVWSFEPPQKRLRPQEEVKFSATYPELPGDVHEVNVRFMLAE